MSDDDPQYRFTKTIAENVRTDDEGAVMGDRIRVAVDTDGDTVSLLHEWMQTSPDGPDASWPWKVDPEAGLSFTALDAEELRDALDEALDFASEVYSTVPTRLELERKLQTCVETLRKIEAQAAFKRRSRKTRGAREAADAQAWAHGALDRIGDDRGAFERAELREVGVHCGECGAPVRNVLVREGTSATSTRIELTDHDRARFVQRYYRQNFTRKRHRLLAGQQTRRT